MAANLELVIKAHDQASAVLKNVDTHANKAGHAMGTILKVGALAAGAGLVAAGFAAVKFIGAASDLNESINKAAVVFGSSSKAVEDFAVTSAKSFGIAKADAFAYAGTLGTILKGSGLTEKASADMSTQLVSLAADMASFNNIPIDQALEKIRAGLVGESEPLRTVGVLLSEAAVAEEAYASGIAAAGSKLTDQQKVQARYNIILKQTADTQGDFQRTSDSLANQQRILGAQWKDLQGIIGNALLPVVVKLGAVFVGFASTAVPKIQDAIRQITAIVGPLIGLFGAALTGNLQKAHTEFLKLPKSLYPVAQALFDIGSLIRTKVFPVLKRLAGFFVDDIVPAVKGFLSQKANLIALGGVIVGLFTAWAISAGIAAAATIAAAAPVYALLIAMAALGGGIAFIEAKTGFFSQVLLPALKDVAQFVGPILGDALVTLKQGWEDLQPALEATAAFLGEHVAPILEKVGAFLKDHPILLIALAAAIGLLVAPWLVVIGTIVLVLAKWDEIKAMFTQTIPQAIDSVINKIQELPIIGAIFNDAWNTVWTIVQTFIRLVLVQVEFLFNTIRNMFAFWRAVFTGDWNAAWGALKAQAEAILNLLSGSFGIALDTLRAILASKIAMLIQIGADIGRAILSGFDAIGVSAALSRPFDIARDAVNWLIRRINDLKDAINGLPSPGDLLPGLPSIPDVNPFNRALGGPVSRGMSYIVGERGPEWFVPRTSGTIIPNAGGVNVAVNFNSLVNTASPADMEEAADLLETLLRRRLRFA